jgi:hypothetical protein
MLNKWDDLERKDPISRPVAAYITHVVYLSEGAVQVNRNSLKVILRAVDLLRTNSQSTFQRLGVECIAVDSIQARFDTDVVRYAMEMILSQTN